MTSGAMLWLLPVLPLLGAPIILGAAVRIGTRIAMATLFAALLLALAEAVLQPTASWPWWGPHLAPAIAVVGISRALVVLVPVIAMPVVLYAAARRTKGDIPRLLALLVAFTGAMELLVVAADFLTLLVAWELVGACSWALIGHEWRDAARPRAARDAFITTRAGDLGLYIAAAAAFSGTGTLRFDALASAPAATLQVVAAGVLVAAAAKSAQLPFSPWLFSAMAGPTAASALLHSATMVAAGAYLLAQLAPSLSATGWFSFTVAGLGLATALAGGIVALAQSDLKKALAASTSAQYGLMLVAVGTGYVGVAGMHLVAHAAFKALLFLGAGVALQIGGTLDLARLRLGSALPWVAALFGVGVLALVAIPPMGAAYTKEQIVAAAAHSLVGAPWLIIGVLAAGFLSALYAMRLQLLAFGPGESSAAHRPAPAIIATLVFLAAISVLLGALWLPGVEGSTARFFAAPLAPDTQWGSVASLTTIVVAAVIGWTLWRCDALLTLGVPDSLRAFVAGWFGIPDIGRHTAALGVALAATLAAFDDRVVDAGIRVTGRTGAWISRTFAHWGERGFDGVVDAVSRAGESLARISGVADARGIDDAVERLAVNVGTAGVQSRRLQSGLTQHYYVIVAIGVLTIVATAAAWRFIDGR